MAQHVVHTQLPGQLVMLGCGSIGQAVLPLILRHLDVVRPQAFAPIAELPVALRFAVIVRALPSREAAADLARAFDIAVRTRQPDGAGRIARRWSAGGDGRRARWGGSLAVRRSFKAAISIGIFAEISQAGVS